MLTMNGKHFVLFYSMNVFTSTAHRTTVRCNDDGNDVLLLFSFVTLFSQQSYNNYLIGK